MKELDSLQSVVGQLALSAPDTQPSAALKHRLMETVHKVPATAAERVSAGRQPFLQRLFPAMGIIAVILILALSATSVLLWQRINQSVSLTGPNGMRAIALQSVDGAPRSGAFVIISADGENGVLVVDDLKQLDPIQQYQVWLIKDKQVTPGPLFTVDQSGYRGLRIVAPQSLLSYSSILVTIEPVKGSTSRPDRKC